MSHIPYTYLLEFTHPQTYEKLYYYGVRYSKNCHPDDLFIKYFTSSKYVKKLIKEFGIKCFKYEVRKIFPNNPLRAHQWEQKVLLKLKAAKRKDFINKSVGGKTFHMFGDENPSSRPEVRDKISNSLKTYYETHDNPFYGRSHSDETKKAISIANKGRKLSDDVRQKMSDSKIGVKRSDEFCQKISKRMSGSNNPQYGNHHAANHLNNNKQECPHCKIITTIGNLKRWHLNKHLHLEDAYQ